MAHPALSQIVNTAVATGTPDDGVLANATATETVGVAIPIGPVNDSASSINGAEGAPNVLNIFDNDTLDGAPATPANTFVTLASGSVVPDELTFDPATGAVGIAPGTPVGTYEFEYLICETANPDNCRTATVTVTVAAPLIEAEDDVIGGIIGATGEDDAINAFDNDELDGEAIDPDLVTATVLTPAEPLTPGALVPELDPQTGLVDVPAGTPAGIYTIVYEICEDLNPDNCAEATITIEVLASVIESADDAPEPVRSGFGGNDIINAFANDTLNGEPVDPADITTTVLVPASDPGVVLDPESGLVSVGPDVPAGTYTIQYEICETLNPDNCSESTITIVVEAPVSALEGTVFYDDNADATLGTNENGAPGFAVRIFGPDGELVGETVADADGNYSFEGLPSGGGYSIEFSHPESGVVFEVIEDLTLAPNVTTSDVNAPIDPSGIVYDSVDRTPIAGATLNLVDANGNPLPDACYVNASQANQTTGASGEYRFDIVPGAASQCPLGETDYRISVEPPAGFSGPSTVIPPLDGPLDPTGLAAPVLINPDNSVPTVSLPPYYLDFELESGDPDIIFNHIPLDPFLTRGELIVSKTSPKRTANVGDIVPYEITVRNAENAQRAGVNVVDILPSGLKYVPGTSLVNGEAQEPESNGRMLTWTNQVIPANGTVTYNLALVIGAGVTGGEKVNTGLAQNNTDGADISNRGTAVVTITPSSVFDCSELIGKVFEDADRDGYQDENEPGVPGVRLATVNGQLITTDEFGRYHIACAAVPNAQIGSNFVLKLDTRTLPLGWEPTTDNPRSIRLTRGKFGELNFGVAPIEDDSANRTEGGE
ncbi:MAG: SdrD B-like domain-containing protein [Erythrobacter sp.]